MLPRDCSEAIKGRRTGGHWEGQSFDCGRFLLGIDCIDTYTGLKVVNLFVKKKKKRISLLQKVGWVTS